ncbi:MAG: hypothetical protein JKY50_09435 [Oleispira sp.]|nr:hypothetical protein [Oleispira sp.]
MTDAGEENHELFEDDSDMLDKALSRLDELPDDDAAVKKAWPKFLRELIEVLKNELVRSGQSKDDALKLAQRLVARQAHHLGGRMVYIPRDERLKLALRDMEIYDNFNGGNSRNLAEHYKLTQQRICNIVKEQHGLFRKRHQPELF